MFSQVPDFKAWFPEIEGFSRPDWKTIGEWIRANVSTDGLDDAWQGIAREWLRRMCEELGGSYAIAESLHFHLLSELETKQQRDLLSFLEKTRARILQQIGDVSFPKRHGKHVILRFTAEDDYYRYTAYFDPEGEYAGSSGKFFSRGYMHIAYAHVDLHDRDRAILVHELTHNLLKSLPLPSWLGEALAMAFELDMTGVGAPLVSRELAQEHREYWNAETIQEFWRGVSFSKLKGQKLSYGLARILLNLVATELRPSSTQFRGFVTHANRKDAGQSAAQEYLGVDLSDVVSTFLGPGEWAPKEMTN